MPVVLAPCITTEHGFSLTIAAGGVYKITQVGPNKWSRAQINAPHHGTAVAAKIPKIQADLIDAGSLTITVQFEGTIGLPTLGLSSTFTLTHPLGASENVAANVAGTGRITEVEYPGGQAGGSGVKTGSFTITWDGGTGPTYSAPT